MYATMECHGYHIIHRKGGKGRSELVHHVIALTIWFSFTEKGRYGIEIEEIQFTMITLSS
jgi:hypothetical protein